MDTLTGGGLIRAAGGAAGRYLWTQYGNYVELIGGGGGGGRVAIYARDCSGFDTNRITASGGLAYTGYDGGAGTVYLKASNEPLGTLIVDAGSGGRNLTPLGVAGMTSMVVNAAMVVRGGAYLQLDGGLTLLGPLTVSGGGVVQAMGLLQGQAAVQVRDGGTLLGGRIEVSALSVVNTGLVSSLAGTSTKMFRLDLVVTNALVVDATSRIDVSNLGYGIGRTLGNTNVGSATGRSGGSYGGLGGPFSYGGAGAPNAVYGDYAAVEEWGSGGEGSAGGGRVRVAAGTLQLDGQLLANALTVCNGAGSGGGVLVVVVSNLVGSGSIEAKGGNNLCGYGGGGGGRIAVYARDFSGFNTSKISAAGGTGGSPGGAGTIYLKNDGEPLGTLFVDAGSGGRNWTPLGWPGTTSVVVNAGMVVRGANSLVGPDHPRMAVTIVGPVRVESGYLQMDDTLTLMGPLTVSSGGVVQAVGLLQGQAAVQVRDGGTLLGGRIEVPSLSVVNTGLVSSLAGTSTKMYRLDLAVANELVVDGTSRIDVSGLGYPPSYTAGNTTVGAATGRSGGSYGGLGGNDSGTANVVYGDYTDPNEWGSGGASYFNPGRGGGLVRLTAGTLTLDGQVLADAQHANDPQGSGGGISVVVQTLRGSGRISAAGGSGCCGNGAGGSGGRIALYAQDYSAFNLSNITAAGGTGSASGGTGTVYLKKSSEALGTLIVDGSSGGAGITPILFGNHPQLLAWLILGNATVSTTNMVRVFTGAPALFQNLISSGRLQVGGLIVSNTWVYGDFVLLEMDRFQGQPLVRLIGRPDRSFVLLATQDFLTWTPVATSSPIGSVWEYVVPDAAQFGHRFYRAQQIAPLLRILSLTRNPGSGQLQLLLSSASGQTIAIQVSPDLLNWTWLGTNVSTSNSFLFLDPTPATNSQRFYRAVRLGQ